MLHTTLSSPPGRATQVPYRHWTRPDRTGETQLLSIYALGCRALHILPRPTFHHTYCPSCSLRSRFRRPPQGLRLCLLAMDNFAAQEPDEGYSEDPLNPTTTQTSTYLAKPRSDAVSALAARRSTVEFPVWLTRHIASLSVRDKTGRSPSCVLPSQEQSKCHHGLPCTQQLKRARVSQRFVDL